MCVCVLASFKDDDDDESMEFDMEFEQNVDIYNSFFTKEYE